MSFVRHRVRTVAFGFFGTLVNELRGLRETLVTVLGPARVHVDLDRMAVDWRDELLRRFARPYRDFPTHLLDSLETVCQGYGQLCGGYDEDDVDLWVQRWPLVGDHYSLARLGQRYRCGLLTQLDKVTISRCLPGLARQPNVLVTSDLSRSYKPNPAYFRLLRVQFRLDEPDELLVVSTERERDLEPSAECGHQTLWIDRSGESDAPGSLTEAIKLL